jgi:hypothetical protein
MTSKSQSKPTRATSGSGVGSKAGSEAGLRSGSKARGQRRPASLKQRFHDRIISKIVDWVLGQHVDEGKVSSMSFDKEEHDLIYKLIDDPKAAEINATVNDPKFRRFFKSVADNGLNTADVQMFYRYRDRLPIKQMNWAYDLEDFELDDEGLISNDYIHAGFYMLEIQTDLPTFRSRVPFEIKTDWVTDKGEGGHTGWLSAISGRLCKRLLWLDHDSIVEIKSQDLQALEYISHLRLSRLTRSFFVSRLMKKLGMRFVLAKHRALTDAQIKDWWQDYDAMFAGTYDQPRPMLIRSDASSPNQFPQASSRSSTLAVG